MNIVIMKGRLTRDPDIRYAGSNEEPVCISRFSLACSDMDRAKDADGSYCANFIPCVCMGKTAEITDKYLCKGKEILVIGKMQSGSYEKEGKKIYTLECFIQKIEFFGKKGDSHISYSEEAFMNIPEGLADELPFR